jgi:hypothetical protein
MSSINRGKRKNLSQFNIKNKIGSKSRTVANLSQYTISASTKEIIYADYVTNVSQGTTLPFSGLPVIDGTTLDKGNILLLTGQVDLSQNRIYEVSAGNWTEIDNPLNELYRCVITQGNYVDREYFISNKEDALNDPQGALIWGHIDLGVISNRLNLTLNKTQLELLHTTPIVLLPTRTQGVGDTGSYIINKCALELDYNTTQYVRSGIGAFRLTYDTILTEFLECSDAIMEEPNDSIVEMDKTVLPEFMDLGLAVSISLDPASSLSAGDSVVHVTLDYTIIGE